MEASLILPLAAATVIGLAWYADKYVTKVRLADSARIIARAIQDDPAISQWSWNDELGDLDRVVMAATGNMDPMPAGFNVETYRQCNQDLLEEGYSDEKLRQHFVMAGAYEERGGVFGDCNEKLINRKIAVNIKAYATQPTKADIAAQFPRRSLTDIPTGGRADGWHPSGRIHRAGSPFAWEISNPNTDKTKPYWISIVAKKPMSNFSILGFDLGLQLGELVNSAVVRVVPRTATLKDPILGEALFAKYATPFDSSPGRGWQDWNASLESFFQTRTDWTPASLETWRALCKSSNGDNIGAYLSKDFINLEYCGRFACFKEFGVWPFMARLLDHCRAGGLPDCHGGQFYLSWVCLNKAP